MKERDASCSCGALHAKCSGEPARLSVCHCLDCKRRTGSAFSYNATYPADRVEVRGDFHSFRRSSDEGFWATYHFCPACGSAVFYEIERRPHMVSIPAGAFADPDFPEPSFSVYENRKHRWVTIDTIVPIEKEA